MLSANKASPPVHVGAVDDDIDYKGEKWERERLDKLAGDVFDRALLPVARVLRDAGNLTLEDVDFVEVRACVRPSNFVASTTLWNSVAACPARVRSETVR